MYADPDILICNDISLTLNISSNYLATHILILNEYAIASKLKHIATIKSISLPL